MGGGGGLVIDVQHIETSLTSNFFFRNAVPMHTNLEMV